MSETTQRESKPMRADAQKNRSHLIDVAHKVFMKKGPDASMEEIARRAEVGIGTLYRHFPTREDLLVTVYAKQIEALIARAHELAASLPPKEALVAWLHAATDHMMTYKALKACIVTIGSAGVLQKPDWYGRLYEANGMIVAAAAKAGAVRTGLDPMDLFRLIHAVTVAAEKSPDPAHVSKVLLDVMIDGLTKPA